MRIRSLRLPVCLSRLAVVVIIATAGTQAGETKPAEAGPSPSEAIQQMSQPGAHEAALAAQTGAWDVVATLWPAPNGSPTITRGLVAQRTMIGAYLQEILQPAPGSATPQFRRLDYLNFDHVEGRWKYVSLDTRFPVSIMPAKSSGIAEDDHIVMQFEPQAFVGFGAAVEGRFMLSNMTIVSSDPNHMVKEQRVNMANGTGESWLLTRYEYVRHSR
jgi:hypothetical protein